MEEKFSPQPYNGTREKTQVDYVCLNLPFESKLLTLNNRNLDFFGPYFLILFKIDCSIFVEQVLCCYIRTRKRW